MDPRNFNSATVRTVAILDFVLTVALVLDILHSSLYSSLGQSDKKGELEMETENHLVPLYALDKQNKPPNIGHISSPALWARLGVVILFGLIACLAAVALLKATTGKLHPDEAFQIIQFWMHCNYLMLITTVLGFFVMLISMSHGWKNQAPGFPFFALLFYFGIRLIFTCVIFSQLGGLRSPPLVASVPLSGAYEPPPGGPWRCRALTGQVRAIEPDTTHDPPILKLGPYRGWKPSASKCQCLAPQTV